MDPLIGVVGRALAAGDPLAALKRIALRSDPPALALRGIAMAQLGDLERARELLRSAGRAFGAVDPLASARCALAEAEIALVSRDLGRPTSMLATARQVLAEHGDRANAAHAGYLEARRLLLIGRLDEADAELAGTEIAALPPASRAGYWLVAAGIAMRRIRAGDARNALDEAEAAARRTGIAPLVAEVRRADAEFQRPAGRLLRRDEERVLALDEVEALLASDTLVVDTLLGAVRIGPRAVLFAGRPVLLALVRTLTEAWPGDVPREILLRQAFGAREADDSHRARLRVEIARLRKSLRPMADLRATARGFVLVPEVGAVAVLAPPEEGEHARVLALLADGEAWSSSSLALALGVSPRTVQRALEALAATGKAESFGRGRACRWIAARLPGFPTSLLLPGPPIGEVGSER